MKILLEEVRACQHCAAHLPHGARPIVQASPAAKILIIGQAPGRKVHESGTPWDDASGNRLRQWLGVDAATFYNSEHFALMPMGFCYPGTKNGADLPPRPECAPLWHQKLLAELPAVELMLLIGAYAQAGYVPPSHAGATLTATVQNWRALSPKLLPLPHPSPRNVRWFKQNLWFEAEVIPHLQARVLAALG